MTTGETPRNEQFLEALAEELRTMSDTDALEGENAEDLAKLGERLIANAREEAGKRRMAAAKRNKVTVFASQTTVARPSVAEAKRYLANPDLTLAARDLNELSDEEVLDLYEQAKSLEDVPDVDAGGGKE